VKRTTPSGTPPPDDAFARQLREMNDALLVSLVRQTELTAQAQAAERKLQEDERVRRKHLALTNASRVSTVGELATGLAHELNQPLASISNLAVACIQYVKGGTIAGDKLEGLLTDIVAQSERAAAIVAHLRSFIDKGEAQIEPVDLADIVRHVPHLLLRELERSGVDLKLALPRRPLCVLADETQIEQVVVNLIQNATDSVVEADGSRRVIELSARSVKGMAEVRVRDTGTGVSDSTAARMFEPFFTTKSHGLGMGLALSRSILEAHRGRIWMEKPSDGGPGTVVSFAIPRIVATKRPRASAG